MKEKKIIVIDPLGTYPRYGEWIDKNFPEHKKLWTKGLAPYEGQKLKLIGSRQGIYLCRSLNNNRVFMLSRSSFKFAGGEGVSNDIPVCGKIRMVTLVHSKKMME